MVLGGAVGSNPSKPKKLSVFTSRIKDTIAKAGSNKSQAARLNFICFLYNQLAKYQIDKAINNSPAGIPITASHAIVKMKPTTTEITKKKMDIKSSLL